jgi:S1-C subfamily serine protease
MYYKGIGVPRDRAEAVKWYLIAAERGDAAAQYFLGLLYYGGVGVPQDETEAVKWYRHAAKLGNVEAKVRLGEMYAKGEGVPKDNAEAEKWYRRAAEQGDANAQQRLGLMYAKGEGVPKNYTLAYAWANLAAAGGSEEARNLRESLEQQMSPEQVAEGQRISADFPPRIAETRESAPTQEGLLDTADVTGSGFFVSENGYFVTNYHVVAGARVITVRTASGLSPAILVTTDTANDLAILKIEGKFHALYVEGSGSLRVGANVSTLGYPNPTIQGLAPKFTTGEVAALSGPGDDPRLIQISASIQPGNSGGPLADSRGRVVGVVVSKLDGLKTLELTGSLPENVNYAIKGTILLGVLEGVPGLKGHLRTKPDPTPPDTISIVKRLEAACGMVIAEK